MNDTHAGDASATAASEPLTGRAAEWAAAGFKEMPEAEKPHDNEETGSDVASLREAGHRIAQPSQQPVTRAYVDAEGRAPTRPLHWSAPRAITAMPSRRTSSPVRPMRPTW